jgi:hypothetical protein
MEPVDALQQMRRDCNSALVWIFLLWRVWRRVRRGMIEKPDQAFLLNLVSQMVFRGSSRRLSRWS